MKRTITGVALGFSVAALTALAAPLPKEGTYDVTACMTRNVSRVAVGNDKAAAIEQFGVSMSNPPGGIFDGESVHCVGMMASLNGEPMVNNVCESLDRDGDRRLTYFFAGPDRKVQRRHIAGTGKYDGLETSGTYTSTAYPAIKDGVELFCNRQQGTYKLR